jgi:predicted phage terminase large subunit-like protein
MDSQLNRLMPSDTGRFTKHGELKTWTEWPDGRVRGWLSVKYRAHNPEMTKFLWPERFSKDHWLSEKEKYASDGAMDLYSQEYMNNPIDESVAYFKRNDILPITQEDKDNRNKTPLVYYCTVDLAISENNRSDWSVFMIAGVDENKVIHIVDVVRERLDGREIVDTILALQRAYEFSAVGIEEMMISKALGPFLREEMVKQGVFPSIVQLKHKGKDKIQRARSIQARMRAKTVKFDKEADWFPALEDELTKFPRGRHDDQVDTLAYLGLLLDVVVEAPSYEELEEEEYLDELRTSGTRGQSRITGY